MYSLNVPAARLGLLTGLDLIVELAHRMGIQSPLRAVPSLALGTSEVSVLELTSAHATLANAGVYAALQHGDHLGFQPADRGVAHPADANSGVEPVGVSGHPDASGGVERWHGETGARVGIHPTPRRGKPARQRIIRMPGLSAIPAARLRRLGGLRSAASYGQGGEKSGIALPVWVSFIPKALSFWPDEKFYGTVGTRLENNRYRFRRARPQRLPPPKRSLPAWNPLRNCAPCIPGGLFGFFYRLK